jgi:hypothetical protein
VGGGLSGEKLGTSILDIQKALKASTSQNASFVASSIAETSRAWMANSAFTQMLESIKQQQNLTRAVFGPFEELRRSGVFASTILAGQREMAIIQEAMNNFEARFHWPAMAETTSLLEAFHKVHVSSPLTVLLKQSSGLQHAIESMHTPWLDMNRTMSSMAAFAEIQNIGRALADLPPFDQGVSSALRTDLGDWRDQIAWPEKIFTDLTARSEFYLDLGFNAALTDFPLRAFEQSLDIAGLRSMEPPPMADGSEPPVSPVEGESDEEEGLMRTNAAHDRLQRLERLLRRFIDDQMRQAFGANWAKGRLPNGLYEQWQDKKQKAEQAGAEQRPLIEYADFTDYALIICRTDNWREVFGIFFIRSESVRETFQRLYPIRLDTMHARLITQDDELLLHVEAKRLEKAIAT